MTDEPARREKQARPLPPVEHRFQKGVSGNPSGRAPGYAEFQAVLRAKSPLAVQQLLKAVAAGKQWGVELMLAYAWGKPTQQTQFLDEHGNPTNPVAVNVLAAAMVKLDSEELRALVEIYRKAGLKLPGE